MLLGQKSPSPETGEGQVAHKIECFLNSEAFRFVCRRSTKVAGFISRADRLAAIHARMGFECSAAFRAPGKFGRYCSSTRGAECLFRSYSYVRLLSRLSSGRNYQGDQQIDKMTATHKRPHLQRFSTIGTGRPISLSRLAAVWAFPIRHRLRRVPRSGQPIEQGCYAHHQ